MEVQDTGPPTGPPTRSFGSEDALLRRQPTAKALKTQLEVTREKTIKEFEEACKKLDAHEYATHDYRAIKAQLNRCVQLAKQLAPGSEQVPIDQLASAMLHTAKIGRQGYKQVSKAIKVSSSEDGQFDGAPKVLYKAEQADTGAKKAALSMKDFLHGIAKLKEYALTPHPAKPDGSPKTAINKTAIEQKVNAVLKLIEDNLETIEDDRIFKKCIVSTNAVIKYIKSKGDLETLEDNYASLGWSEQLPDSVAGYDKILRDSVKEFEGKFDGLEEKEKARLKRLFYKLYDLSNLYDAIKKAGEAGDLPALQKLFETAVKEEVIRQHVLSSFNQLIS